MQNEEIILETINRFDGIIISGGSDIDPEYYNQINSGKSLEVNSFRDKCEEKIIRILIESDIPVLGICRGMQLLNVALGGTLIQDLPLSHLHRSHNGIDSAHSLRASGILSQL